MWRQKDREREALLGAAKDVVVGWLKATQRVADLDPTSLAASAALCACSYYTCSFIFM